MSLVILQEGLVCRSILSNTGKWTSLPGVSKHGVQEERKEAGMSTRHACAIKLLLCTGAWHSLHDGPTDV